MNDFQIQTVTSESFLAMLAAVGVAVPTPAPTPPTPPTPLPFLFLEQTAGATPAQQWTALDTALETALVVVISGAWQIDQPIPLVGAHTLMGCGSSDNNSITQMTDNVPIIQPTGSKANLKGLTLAYNDYQPQGNTGAVAIQYAAAGDPNLWSNSRVEDIKIVNARDGIGPQGGSGEFQNLYQKVEFQACTGISLNLPNGGSGSMVVDCRFQGTGGSGVPGSPDSIYHIYAKAIDNLTVSHCNFEHAYPWDGTLSTLARFDAQCNVILDDCHIEAVNCSHGDWQTRMISLGEDTMLMARNLVVDYLPVNTQSFIFSLPQFTSGGGQVLIVDGVSVLNSTFGSGIYLYFHDTNNPNPDTSSIALRGTNSRNPASFINNSAAL
jgi:hypothetical protein